MDTIQGVEAAIDLLQKLFESTERNVFVDIEGSQRYEKNRSQINERIQVCKTCLSEVVEEVRASQWTPISQIPEEWKDGRLVDLWTELGTRKVDCSYRLCGHANGKTEEGMGWVERHNLWITDAITHAKLPKSP